MAAILTSYLLLEKSRSKLTTVRIPEDLHRIILIEAREENIGFNTVVNRLLRKHVEWDRFANRFGMVSLSRETIVSLLDAIDDEKIEEIAESLVPKIKEMVDFWFQSSDLESWIKFLTLISKYGGEGTVFANTSGAQTKLHLRHGLGSKWTRLFAVPIETVLAEMGVKSEVQKRENSLTIIIPTSNVKQKQSRRRSSQKTD